MMYEIYLVVLAIAMMAKARRRRKRSFAGYVRGNIDLDTALGTLAGKTAVLQASQTVSSPCRVSSVKAIYSLHGMTVGDNIGPIMVGVAHSDYTLAELEEWIEAASGSWQRGKLVEQEIDNRLIRRIGVFTPLISLGAEVLNDGKPIRTKLNWALQSAQGLNFWYYNMGTAALATTDPNGHVQGQANLFFTV